MLAAVRERRGLWNGAHNGPSSMVVSVLLNIFCGSQLPPEPQSQEGEARAAWCVVSSLGSHTAALPLDAVKQSGHKANGFKGRGPKPDLSLVKEHWACEMLSWPPWEEVNLLHLLLENCTLILENLSKHR